MRVGVLGTGMVGQTIGTKLVSLGHRVMMYPARIGGEHDVFVSGNDAGAEATVIDILKTWFGWKSVIDVGDITTARGTEQLLPIWVRLMAALGTTDFNFRIAR